jgi:hypothetical protein
MFFADFPTPLFPHLVPPITIYLRVAPLLPVNVIQLPDSLITSFMALSVWLSVHLLRTIIIFVQLVLTRLPVPALLDIPIQAAIALVIMLMRVSLPAVLLVVVVLVPIPIPHSPPLLPDRLAHFCPLCNRRPSTCAYSHRLCLFRVSVMWCFSSAPSTLFTLSAFTVLVTNPMPLPVVSMLSIS